MTEMDYARDANRNSSTHMMGKSIAIEFTKCFFFHDVIRKNAVCGLMECDTIYRKKKNRNGFYVHSN